MRRRKNQLVDMKETSLPIYDKTPASKETYEKAYQSAYHKAYRKKKKPIRILLDADEHKRLMEKADREGVPLTKYVMDRFYAQEKTAEVKSMAYRETIKHLAKMGTNLNQVATVLNSKKTPFLFNSTKDLLKTIRSDLKTLLKLIMEGRLVDA
jgi:hypothetical protein